MSFLKKKYTINTNRVGFSYRKLAEKYYNETGKSVSHVAINNALKRLGMHYLKFSPGIIHVFKLLWLVFNILDSSKYFLTYKSTNYF